jgi:protein-L-isoaspartate(D-aspartate) O-methyltransferase
MITREDTYKHKGWRRNLINILKEKGITNQLVLDAFDAVPRHYFLDPAFEHIAYEDRAFTILANQTISQPYTVAYQSSLLNIESHHKVLEIGTGSAFQATILAELGAFVFTIERQKELFDNNKDNYPFINKYPKLKFFYGDGFEGLPTFAPFDKVLITAAAPYVPPKLIAQMKIGAQMVIPEAEGDKQRMKRITKISATETETELFDEFSFVPMLMGKSK